MQRTGQTPAFRTCLSHRRKGVWKRYGSSILSFLLLHPSCCCLCTAATERIWARWARVYTASRNKLGMDVRTRSSPSASTAVQAPRTDDSGLLQSIVGGSLRAAWLAVQVLLRYECKLAGLAAVVARSGGAAPRGSSAPRRRRWLAARDAVRTQLARRLARQHGAKL
jgi:hypothetical protein